MADPLFSFVLATHNRRDVVLNTLDRLTALTEDLPVEILVVDNRSTDHTPDAIRTSYSSVHLTALSTNRGSCAKALGAEHACGRYVVFLDDDSYPQPGTLDAMAAHFEADPQLGAAACIVRLPDGRRESSALPHVFVGCGVGFRRAALEQVGGLDGEFFMQAEEYDLSFRLVNDGWHVETFADLHVDHLKTPTARISRRTLFYDTRNNRIVAARYLPDERLQPIRADWTQRYRWIGQAAGHRGAFWRGWLAGTGRFARERRAYQEWRLSPDAFETLFCFRQIAERLEALAAEGVKRIVLADLGKNILPFVHGAAEAGIEVAAIADDRFARPGRRYRGILIEPTEVALNRPHDAVVIANCSPAHATHRQAALAARTPRGPKRPVYNWFSCEAILAPTVPSPSTVTR
jgi:GT2 family glycosyltransferase